MKHTIEKLHKKCQEDDVQKIVVGAIIFQEDKILMLRRAPSEDFLPGLIELPSGTVDPGENILDALHRELKEETNLVMHRVSDFIGFFDYFSGSGKKTRQLNFVVDVSGKVALNPEEHDVYFFYTMEDMSNPTVNISDLTRATVLKAFNQK